jgi:hypothetical protein
MDQSKIATTASIAVVASMSPRIAFSLSIGRIHMRGVWSSLAICSDLILDTLTDPGFQILRGLSSTALMQPARGSD